MQSVLQGVEHGSLETKALLADFSVGWLELVSAVSLAGKSSVSGFAIEIAAGAVDGTSRSRILGYPRASANPTLTRNFSTK